MGPIIVADFEYIAFFLILITINRTRCRNAANCLQQKIVNCNKSSRFWCGFVAADYAHVKRTAGSCSLTAAGEPLMSSTFSVFVYDARSSRHIEFNVT